MIRKDVILIEKLIGEHVVGKERAVRKGVVGKGVGR